MDDVSSPNRPSSSRARSRCALAWPAGPMTSGDPVLDGACPTLAAAGCDGSKIVSAVATATCSTSTSVVRSIDARSRECSSTDAGDQSSLNHYSNQATPARGDPEKK